MEVGGGYVGSSRRGTSCLCSLQCLSSFLKKVQLRKLLMAIYLQLCVQAVETPASSHCKSHHPLPGAVGPSGLQDGWQGG